VDRSRVKALLGSLSETTDTALVERRQHLAAALEP
jgi:hypothetical protein